MKSKGVSITGPAALGLRALLMGVMGYLMLARPAFVKGSLTLILIVALALNGLTTLAAAWRQMGSWVSGAVSLALAVMIGIWPGLLAVGTSMAYGLWMLLNAVIQLSYAVQLFVTRSRGKWLYVSLGLISLLIGIEMVFHPITGAESADLLAGVYFLLFAAWLLADMVAALLQKNVESSPVLSRLRIKPPVILTALLPSRALKRIRAQASQAAKDQVTEKPTRNKKKAYASELQVVFHLGEAVAFGFGHTDIQFHGSVYSYGCYDAGSNKLLGMISDGVFMTAPGGPYLDYCRRYEGKSLVGYVIGLSAEAEQRVDAALTRTLAPCRPWQPSDSAAAQGTPAHCRQTIGSRYWKVPAGPFRYYNVFKTNCAAMAEILANESGVHLLPPGGAVTPGGYFAFLEKELTDPASDVIRRIVYRSLGAASEAAADGSRA